MDMLDKRKPEDNMSDFTCTTKTRAGEREGERESASISMIQPL